MEQSSGRSLIKWLELTVSGRWKKLGAKMTVHPVSVGEGQQCFAMALDQRWLCGSDGALTFFDSMTAATRFLQLLNVDNYVEGEGCGRDTSWRDAFQCFQLDAKGLRTCDKCRIGGDSRAQAMREFARCEERW